MNQVWILKTQPLHDALLFDRQQKRQMCNLFLSCECSSLYGIYEEQAIIIDKHE